jgi:hypothetical protein
MHSVDELHRCANLGPLGYEASSPIPRSSRRELDKSPFPTARHSVSRRRRHPIRSLVTAFCAFAAGVGACRRWRALRNCFRTRSASTGGTELRNTPGRTASGERRHRAGSRLDFHLGTLLGKNWLATRIDQIQTQRPDIIVLGGDIIEGDDPSESELLPSFRRLSALFGVWGVTGNHEFQAGIEGGVNLLEETGVHVLHDRWAEVRPGLILAGVDDLTSRRRRGETGNFVERALAGRACRYRDRICFSHTLASGGSS